jgi:hypothetical protein
MQGCIGPGLLCPWHSYTHAHTPIAKQGGEKWPGQSAQEELAKEKFVSALPFLPPLSAKTLNTYYTFYACFGEGWHSIRG